MAYEQKNNSGAIFRNNKREKDTHPNMTGKAMVNGVMVYVSAWTKERENGEKWLSLSFTPVEKEQCQEPKRGEFEDDIPW